MTADHAIADRALTGQVLRDHPVETARAVEGLTPEQAAKPLSDQPLPELAAVCERMTPLTAGALLEALPAEQAIPLLAAMQPTAAVAVLAQMDQDRCAAWLAALDPRTGDELRGLLDYPPDSAGRLMSRRLGHFRGDMDVAAALERLRRMQVRDARTLLLLDEDGHLVGRV